MNSKYKVGELVKTVRSAKLKASGVVTEVNYPPYEIQLLWGTSEPHYIVKDAKTNEFLSVIEKGLERI